MSSLSKIGIALTLIFIFFLLVILVETLYLFLRRREFHRRFNVNDSIVDVHQSSRPSSKEVLYFLSTWRTYNNNNNDHHYSRDEPITDFHTDASTITSSTSASDHDRDINDQLYEELDRSEEGGIRATPEICLNSITINGPMEEDFSNKVNSGVDSTIIRLSESDHYHYQKPTTTTCHDELYEENRSELEGGIRVTTTQVCLNSADHIGPMKEDFLNESNSRVDSTIIGLLASDHYHYHYQTQTTTTCHDDQLYEENRSELDGGIRVTTTQVCLNSADHIGPMEEGVDPTPYTDATIIRLSPCDHYRDDHTLTKENRFEEGEIRVTLEECLINSNSLSLGTMEEEFSNEMTPFSTPCASPPMFFTPSASPTRT